jgi:hypothetical protein
MNKFLILCIVLVYQSFHYIYPTQVIDHGLFNELLQKHVSAQGNVDYKGFELDKAILKSYIKSLGEDTPADSWTKEDKLAYWINAYNALTIDLILRNPKVNSVKDIKNPWNQRLWKLGDDLYDLNQIEHKILRKMQEPRIHFAIVCASVSCPKLQNQAFVGSNIDSQLNRATKEFLNDTTKNVLTKNNLKLSKIFDWFSKDFKHNGTLIDFLNNYSDIKISQKASISYIDYDWNLND